MANGEPRDNIYNSLRRRGARDEIVTWNIERGQFYVGMDS